VHCQRQKMNKKNNLRHLKPNKNEQESIKTWKRKRIENLKPKNIDKNATRKRPQIFDKEDRECVLDEQNTIEKTVDNERIQPSQELDYHAIQEEFTYLSKILDEKK